MLTPRFRYVKETLEKSVALGGMYLRSTSMFYSFYQLMWLSRYVHDWRPYFLRQYRFCVVRNPYARALSEYGSQVLNLLRQVLTCSFRFRHGRKIRELPCDALNLSQVNVWLRDRMTRQAAGKEPTLDDCHWYPQHDYIHSGIGVFGGALPQHEHAVGGDNNSDGNARSCNIVLRMERLSEDFAKLMSLLNLTQVKLPKAKSFTSGCKDLGILEESTRKVIRKTYSQDFNQFGYEM